MSCRDIYLRIEKVPAYSPVAPEQGEHEAMGALLALDCGGVLRCARPQPRSVGLLCKDDWLRRFCRPKLEASWQSTENSLLRFVAWMSTTCGGYSSSSKGCLYKEERWRRMTDKRRAGRSAIAGNPFSVASGDAGPAPTARTGMRTGGRTGA